MYDLPVDPVTLVRAAALAYRGYGLAAGWYEKSKWRDLTFTEAENVRALCESLTREMEGLSVDVWPDRQGHAYVSVTDRRGAGWKTMGVAWDRWVDRRLDSWGVLLKPLSMQGYKVDFEGLHGFTVTSKRV